MITSMTGYGRGTNTHNGLEVTVEIRSVNNRFLDISLKLPRSLSAFEQHIREAISKSIKRGRVNVWVALKGDEDKSTKFTLNHGMVKEYVRLATELEEKYGFPGKPAIEQIMALPDVVTIEPEEQADEEIWQCADIAISQALQELDSMRIREGEEIYKDFENRIDALDILAERVKKIADDGPKIELSKLKERVKRLIDNDELDEYRLELEMALISDRIDISEECTRFFSHIVLFRELLNKAESQGRKLNFLLQEMNREANTMASKTFTPEISHLVVSMKEEIEKIREQVQNIE